ncbi:MAG: hypothetical protein Q7S23_06115 [bacterium]|nr:hypothetical protein [bacterium]
MPAVASTRIIAPETAALLLLGALDVVNLRAELPLPVWTAIANLFWLLALVALVADLAARSWSSRLRGIAIGAALVLLLGVTTVAFIALRRAAGPAMFVHDNAILIEEGVRELRAGSNFYAVDYLGTPLQQWQGGQFYDASSNTWFANPALFHYITLPFYTVASAGVAMVSEPLFGFYDQRITHLAALALLAAAAWTLPRRKQDRLAYLVVLLANPFAVAAVTMGTSDTFVLAFLVAAVAAFAAGRGGAGAVALALAATSKQTAWLVIPFLAAYWWWEHPRQRRQLWLLPAVAVVITAPFALWNWPAFWDDVYRYPAGLLPTSYPIYGLGLSVLLQLLGLPSSPRAYFPYGMLQLTVVIPLFFLLLTWQRRDNDLSRALAGSAVLLLAFWWLSRFFNENYVWVIIALLATAWVRRPASSQTS